MQHMASRHHGHLWVLVRQHLANPQCTSQSTKLWNPPLSLLRGNITNASVATLTNVNFHQQQWSTTTKQLLYAQNLSWKWLFTASNCNHPANLVFSTVFQASAIPVCKSGQAAVTYRFPSDHRSQAPSSGVSTWMGDHPGTPRAVGNTWCTGHMAKPRPQVGRVC